jgi:hypothetical protein
MAPTEMISIIQNLGVPVGILAYVLWRGDKFLGHLTRKLDKFNDELTTLNVSIQDLIHTIKYGKG